MKKLEKDKTVVKWTKNHGITIQYITEAGNTRGYRPDFLLERIDGTIELHEIKGGQFMQNLDTMRKHEAAMKRKSDADEKSRPRGASLW